MLKSLHIGRYVSRPEDLLAMTAFLEAIGLNRGFSLDAEQKAGPSLRSG
jgi:hypothetical protein